MTINNRLLAVLMIAATWTFAAIAVVMSVNGRSDGVMMWMIIIGIAVASALTYGILGAYEKQSSPDKRSWRVNRLINELDERDLDLLRDRLAYRDDGEYESLEALLNSPKRKNG